MYLSPEEIALAMQMNGTSAKYLLVQEHLAEPRTTTHLLEQVSSCREVLNILDWKFPAYKNSSASYKLLCSILHNPTKFKGVMLNIYLCKLFYFNNFNYPTGNLHIRRGMGFGEDQNDRQTKVNQEIAIY
jgi:hypothetical protein